MCNVTVPVRWGRNSTQYLAPSQNCIFTYCLFDSSSMSRWILYLGSLRLLYCSLCVRPRSAIDKSVSHQMIQMTQQTSLLSGFSSSYSDLERDDDDHV